MRYLILTVSEEASEEIVQYYADLLLEQAANDTIYTGMPMPFEDTFFVGNLNDFNQGPR